MSEEQSSESNSSNQNKDNFFALSHLLTNIISTIGVPGCVLIFVMWLITKSTPDQFKEIINQYVLFKDPTPLTYAFFVIIVIYVLGKFWVAAKILRTQKAEINRLAKQKSDAQQSKIPNKKLHHSK